MSTSDGINDLPISDMPIAILDLETTGLHPSGDRVVEIAVVRVDPGHAPELVLDTLINPKRKVKATEIHGITDKDVADAPLFEDISGNLAEAIADCVVASYNIYFDVKFLHAELDRIGLTELPPHLCLMYMRSLLGMGNRCSLGDACQECGISIDNLHMASDDAIAGAKLWQLYLKRFPDREVRTFGDLAALGSYKFFDSFSIPPFASSLAQNMHKTSKLKSRRHTTKGVVKEEIKKEAMSPMSIYWDALTSVMSDLIVTEDEADYLRRKRLELDLNPEEIRWLHARLFSGILADMCDDMKIDDGEVKKLKMVAEGLRGLGWMPGESGYL